MHANGERREILAPPMELIPSAADWTVVAFAVVRLIAVALLAVAVWRAVRRRRS